MNAKRQHSIVEPSLEHSSFTIFQPSFFRSSFEPESLENFDFESVPMANSTKGTHENTEEAESIPQSSGLTLNTSYASTVPILQNQKYSQTLSTATEEFSMDTIPKDNLKKDSNETMKQQKPNLVYRDQPFRNYQIFPSNTQFLLDGRLVTSKDYRAFIAALFLMITPVVLFAIFK